MAQLEIDSELQRIHEQLLRGPEKWVHHAADLTRDGVTLTSEGDRPVSTFDRLERIDQMINIKLPRWGLA